MRHEATMKVIGNITTVKTFKVGKNQTTKINFGIGVNKWRKNGDKFDKLPTVWIDCIAWGKTAKKILDMQIQKGSLVSIQGEYRIDIVPATEKYPKELRRPIVWVNQVEVFSTAKQSNDSFDFIDENDNDE